MPAPNNGVSLGDVFLEKADRFLGSDGPKDRELFQLEFLSKGFTLQILQTWSHSSQLNRHSAFIKSSTVIVNALRYFDEVQEFSEYGVEIIKNILTKFYKTLYRGLSSMRPFIATSLLRLMNEMILFKKSAMIDEFLALFDFTLPVLPKLLIPTKAQLVEIEKTKDEEHSTIRYCFIRFLLNILQHASPIVRKDFLSDNTKLTTIWIKFITTIDSNALVDITLSTWEETILKEQSFKKATKLKIFNEWNLPRLLPIFYNPTPEIQQKFVDFISLLSTNSRYGLKFSAHETWFLEGSGGIVSVNGENYKTNNKVIYSLVTALKPWDDDKQFNTTLTILSSIPELIPPYVNYLSSRGAHDPKLSSYWLGITLLLNKLLQLEIPSEIIHYAGTVSPSNHIISQLSLPSLLNRSTLTKCLQSEVFLIRQLSIQLMIFSIQKLKQITYLYEKKGWHDAKIDLVNTIYKGVPELSTVCSSLTDSYTKHGENKILLLTYLTCMNEYIQIFPDRYNYSTHISKPYVDMINKAQFSGIDLVLLDNFFQLQEGDNSQVKWWNKSDDAFSLFTLLLKLAAFSETSSVSLKVSKILTTLVKQTVVFNYNKSKVDQVILLVQSLQEILSGSTEAEQSSEILKIWKLIDESISRCVRTPFKYLDVSNSLDRVSPFVVTLFEQWKFVDKTTNYFLTSKWFVLFLRLLVISGEPLDSIQSLLKTAELEHESLDWFLDIDNHEANIKSLNNDLCFTKLKTSSYFEFVTTSQLDKLEGSLSIPVSLLDVVGILFRLKSIINANSISYKHVGIKNVLSRLLLQLENFCLSNVKLSTALSSKKFWGDLYLTSSCEKAVTVSCALSELLSQLKVNNTEFAEIVQSYLAKPSLSSEEESVISVSLWSLDDETLKSVLTLNSTKLRKSALLMILERKSYLRTSEIEELIVQDESLVPIISHLVSSNLVVYDDLHSLLSLISEHKSRFPILSALLSRKDLTVEILKFTKTLSNIYFTIYVLSSLEDGICIVDGISSIAVDLSELSKAFALDLLQNSKFDVLSFTQLSSFFTKPFTKITKEEKTRVLNYAFSETTNKYTLEVAKLILSLKILDDRINGWLNKSLMHITRMFAEHENFSDNFRAFTGKFREIILNLDIIRILHKKNLNALLEVVLGNRVREEIALELVVAILLSAKKHHIESNKLLQIVVNNENNALSKVGEFSSKAKFYTSLIILKLFEFEEAKHGNISIQEQTLRFYGGSTRPEDIILLKILEKLETKQNYSWVDSVCDWDLISSLTEEEQDIIGETKLIERKRDGLIVTLNKNYITNTIQNYNICPPKLGPLSFSPSENWSTAIKFYDSASLDSDIKSVNKTRYDPLFLLLLIINNEELFKPISEAEQQIKVGIQKLIDSNLLEFILINLSSQDELILEITIKILSAILVSLKSDSNFRDRLILELLLSKIVFTFKKESEIGKALTPLDFPPIIFVFIGRIFQILMNPGHILYEKCFRWVLKSPMLKQYELPLYNDISIISGSTEDSDIYYRQLNWLLSGLVIGTKTKSDIKLLRNKNVFEWIMNLELSPYLHSKLKYQIYQFISVVQEVEDGTDLLITGYGGLTNSEQRVSYHSIKLHEVAGSTVEGLSNRQSLLNIQELGLRFGTVVDGKKRVIDWTNDDLPQFVKRLSTTI